MRSRCEDRASPRRKIGIAFDRVEQRGEELACVDHGRAWSTESNAAMSVGSTPHAVAIRAIVPGLPRRCPRATSARV
jgi:hypothetical protein